MIVIVKKNNIALIALIFILSILLYSINVGLSDDSASTTGQAGPKTVLLDPGHGGEDPGAVSDYSGIKESSINLYIANRVKELLEKDNYTVLMTRQDDVLEYAPGTSSVTQKRKQDLLRRKNMMDTCGADIVVSIHLNKFDQTQYFGAQSFFPAGCKEGQKLAENIQKSVKEKVDPQNMRQALVKKEQIIITKNWKTPIAIVECGFLSNQADEAKLATKEYQDKLACAIKDGIVNYYKSK